MSKKNKIFIILLFVFCFISSNHVFAVEGVCEYVSINLRGNYQLYSATYDSANYRWAGYSHNGSYYLIAYTAKAACQDDKSTTYDAFCIDPARDNPHGETFKISEELDLSTVFGRAIYYLYTDYYLHNKTDEGLFISTQVSRFLVKKYIGFLDGSHKSSLTAYMNSSITPSKAAAVFNQVEAKAMSTTEEDILGMTATLDLEVAGGEDSAGDVREGIEFTLTANNVTEPSNLKNISYTVVNGAGQDISSMFTISGQNNWQTSDGNSVATITVRANDTYDEAICNIKLQVSADYSDDYSISNIFIVQAASANDAANFQRFLIFNKQGEVRLGAEAETPAYPECGQEEDAKCFTFQSFLCLPTSNTNYIIEGVNLNTMAVDWDNCVIDQQDPAGNDYNVIENDYCKIACKEDFAFRLPGGLGDFSQGRYIPVNLDGYTHTIAGVATQKSCVTSEILVDQYIEDATILKNNMLTYLNRYYYYIGMLKWLLTPENVQKYKNNVRVVPPACDSMDVISMSANILQGVCLAIPPASKRPYGYVAAYDYDFEYEQYEFEYQDEEEQDVIAANIVKSEETQTGNSSNDASFIGEIEGEEKPGLIESIVNEFLDLDSGTIPSGDQPYLDTVDAAVSVGGIIATIITAGGAAETVTCTAVFTCHGSNIPPEQAKNIQLALGIAKVVASVISNAKNYNDTRDILIEKTDYIKDCTRWNSGKNYEYQVELDFDYDEQEYINMILNDTQLEIDNEPEYPFSYNLYCEEMTEVDNMYTECKPGINAPSTGNSLLDGLVSSIISGVESSIFGIEKKDVEISNSANLLSTGASLIDLGVISDKSYVNLNPDDFYFYIRRLASIAMYGYPGVGLTGGVNLETVFSLFLQEAIRIFSNKAFIYYKPKYSFFTTPDKGIVSLTPMTEDSELIDTDGLVYPIKLTTQPGDYLYKLTFENVGQYFPNETQYGRVLGSSGYVSILPTIEVSTGIGIVDNFINSAIGSVTGYEKNEYLCDYSVCAVDDPNCEDDPTTPPTEETETGEEEDGGEEDGGNTPNEGANCQSIYSSQTCSNDATLDDCITQLLNDNCCSYVDALGKMVISQNTIDQYNAVCGKNFCCSGTGIIDGSFSSSVGGSPSGGIGSGNNYVNNASTIDNKLEFFSKVVSLNDLFPNDDESRGFNWIGATSDGLEIDTVISEIEEKGESIYSEEPEYSLILDPTCAARIREYNAQQEASDLGFNDFTLKKYDSVFLNELESYGCVVVNDNTDNDKSD